MNNRGREPLKDRIKRNAAAFELLRPPGVEPASIYAGILNQVDKPKRAAPKPSGRPLESDVQREILSALKAHPVVAFVGRFNRGQAIENGRRISYNSVSGFPDIHGLRGDGKAFYFEVKRDADYVLTDAQANFIQIASTNNAIAAVVWTPAMAIAILDAA